VVVMLLARRLLPAICFVVLAIAIGVHDLVHASRRRPSVG
jgi:uncharacterized membrane protein